MAWNDDRGWDQVLQTTLWEQGAATKPENLEEDIPFSDQINNTNANNKQNLAATTESTLSESLMELEEDPEDGYFSTESHRQLMTSSASGLKSWRHHKPCCRQLFGSGHQAIAEIAFEEPSSETTAICTSTFEVSQLLPAPATTTNKAVSYWKAGTEDSSEAIDFEDRQLDELKSLLFVPYDDQQDWQFKDPASDLTQDQRREKTLSLFKCKTCGAKFKFRQWLKAHEQRHCGSQLQCSICGKTFLKKILLKLHLSRHGQQRKKRIFQGSLNDVKVKTKWPKSSRSNQNQNNKQKEQLKKQYDSVRAVRGQKQVFECPQCPKVYRSKRGFFEHQSIHTGIKYSCPHCSKEFTTCTYLAYHVKKLHFHHRIPKPSIASEVHECNICFSKFETFGDLRIHRRIHFGGNPYECFVCGLKYSGEKELQAHRKSHKVSGDKPFDCHICGNDFGKKISLQLHMKRGHSDRRQSGRKSMIQELATPKVPEFKCAHCPKVFCKLASLTRHEKSHNAAADRPFKCLLCGRKFRAKPALDVHMKVHSGEKPFKCSMCSLTFTKLGNLQSHELNHTDVHPYKCSLCGCSFPSKISLRTHQFRSHILKTEHCII